MAEIRQLPGDPIGPRGGPPVRGRLRPNVFVRLESKHTSLQAWFRDSDRSSSEGSGEGGPTPVLFFVPEARWRDRSLVVEGQHALTFADSVALHSILTFNRYEVEPESRYVFPNGMGGLFLDDFKYAIGTSASLEEKLDVQLEPRHPAGGRGGGHQLRHHPQGHHAGRGQHATGRRHSGRQPHLLHRWPTTRRPQVDVNRTVNLQYQQFGAYAEGAHNFNDYLRAIAGVRRRRQHPLRGGPDQPARRPHRQRPGRPADAEIHLLDGLRGACALLLLQRLRQRRADQRPTTPTSIRSGPAPTRSNISLAVPNTCCSAAAATTTSSRPADHQPVGGARDGRRPRWCSPTPTGRGARRLAQSVNLGSSTGMGLRPVLPLQHRRASRAGAPTRYVDFSRTPGPAGVRAAPDLPPQRPPRLHAWHPLQALASPPAWCSARRPRTSPTSTATPGSAWRRPTRSTCNALFTPVDALDLLRDRAQRQLPPLRPAGHRPAPPCRSGAGSWAASATGTDD